jgi:2-methylcitrate dehydratase PrpD
MDNWIPNQEQRVVRFIHSTCLQDCPPAVVRQAKRCFLDLLSCSFAGLDARASQIARSFALSFGGNAACSLWGDGGRVPLPLAIYANTTICEALDADDGYNFVKGHPGAFLLPATLAFAERGFLDGAGALEALIAGYEVGMRAGRIVHAMNSAYHGSGSWGGVGTAAVAARALGLDDRQTAHALGTAEYHGVMAPIMRCVTHPGMVKDGVAWSAFSAVSGALMSRDGFTSTISLFSLTDAKEWVESLGSEFLIEQLYFKPYCSCRWAQPAICAALWLVREHDINLDAIDSIRVETFTEACELSRKRPVTSEEAQYSLRYPVAAALLRGDFGPSEVLESNLDAPDIWALAQRIECVAREEFQRQFPARRVAEIFITSGGRSFRSGAVSVHGDPDEPMSEGEIEDKFLRYSSHSLSSVEAGECLDRIRNLEREPNLNWLIGLLRRPVSFEGRAREAVSSVPATF